MSLIGKAFPRTSQEENKLDKAIEALKSLDELYTKLNRNERQKSFFKYLAFVARDLGLDDTARVLVDVDDLLYHQMAKREFIDTYKTKESDKDETVGAEDMEPTFLNKPFREIAEAAKEKSLIIPTAHMNFMLHSIGQKLLPGGKIGWRHTVPFGQAPA